MIHHNYYITTFMYTINDREEPVFKFYSKNCNIIKFTLKNKVF